MKQKHLATQFALDAIKLSLTLTIDKQHALLWERFAVCYGRPVNASNAQLATALIQFALDAHHKEGRI